MKLIFAGTPPLAAQALEALLVAGHDVVLVLTQPDRPARRGMRMQASAVKTTALAHGLPLAQVNTLKNTEAYESIASVKAEVMVVAAYGLIVPETILSLFRRGCLNIHASLLPRWRGAAPIQRAIEAGDRHSGITIMQMDAGLDTGPILAQYPIDIAADETSASLYQKLSVTGAEAIVATLAQLDRLTLIPQSQEGVSYASKLLKQEAEIEWSRPAQDIAQKIRAFNPAPGAYTYLNGAIVKLWMACAKAGEGPVGRIVYIDKEAIWVGSAEGLVGIQELQQAGARKLNAREFVVGRPALFGEQFLTKNR